MGRRLPQKSNFASLKEYSFKVKKRSFCVIKISMLTLKICKFLKHDHVILNATDITRTFEQSRVRTSKVGELLMSPLSPFMHMPQLARMCMRSRCRTLNVDVNSHVFNAIACLQRGRDAGWGAFFHRETGMEFH